MARPATLVAYDDLDSQVEALERDGYVYFPGVLNTKEIAELHATMEYPPYLNKFQFDESILAQANPRQRCLLGDHRPSNYD